MPLYSSKNNGAKQLMNKDFKNEKELQDYMERNLQELFNIRYLASQYFTGRNHGGRIDTLGLDENNSPVIIEYKWGEKDNIINQGLFYLDWLIDHTGDFQILVQNHLGMGVQVDFGSPRVVLVAQKYHTYDQHAINRMSENIELWSYARYENNVFELRRVASSQAKSSAGNNRKQISKVNYTSYTIEAHIEGKSDEIKELFSRLQEKIFSLEGNWKIEEKPRQEYIAYSTSKNFVELLIQNQQIKIYLDIPYVQLENPKGIGRDVSAIGHLGTGSSEIIYKSLDELDYITGLIEQSYLQSV